ncbi:hypothetical protein Q428_09245 [Fervidicella metallireducens AeB]|uniref:Uncharacterized protein n=1 Tax=Fervidicella metallireducens AeB TaxID=1403537 RepID=A0A017RUC3_9CLOT|nr:hypothetical protein [Fervidicella metallireducens]EYE88206.1 hypothetical protein Q428_09245 [Fervidicella metallireducens AeB]
MCNKIKLCILEENKECTNCNRCNICDLDDKKICDSCGKCINLQNVDYKEIPIEGFLDDSLEVDEYLYETDLNDVEQNDFDMEYSEELEEIEYIEDIPKLREEYERKMQEIFLKKN